MSLFSTNHCGGVFNYQQLAGYKPNPRMVAFYGWVTSLLHFTNLAPEPRLASPQINAKNKIELHVWMGQKQAQGQRERRESISFAGNSRKLEEHRWYTHALDVGNDGARDDYECIQVDGDDQEHDHQGLEIVARR